MAKTKLPYPPQFRRQMVELVHAGRMPEELAAQFGPTAQSIRTGLRSLSAMRGAATAA
jgi:transposase